MNEMDMAVNIRHIQNGKSLLATASVTLGGCFAVQGIQVREGKNGVFVSMPQRKDAKGRYHDVCFPTTAEMRRAINAAVLGEYERTAPAACLRTRRPARENARAGQERGEGQEPG